ncbi:hypothetical protein AGOR_G00194910 [Albula goreensis]|uniref:Ig-like domain-containing protein n=1 Tax=Albula goreensis TaxID=1534307 RepID=A0A8T3CU33_9TELE|nr:hypothetical protein AGOR_G00194910 [Albula goreensis]
MKHQWTADMRRFCSVFVLLITAVSVSSAQAVELNLRVGETVTFPTVVRSNGGLTYSGSTIGDVSGGQFTPLPSEQYRGRVQWDSSTGLFSITGLKMEDSGRYRVKNDANLDTVYQLTVFTNVSSPLLTLTHDKYPCTLLCTVDRGTQVTLSLYREGEGERYVNYPPVNAPHHLPQTVDRSGTYTCEAKNSVSQRTTSITVGDHCTEGSTGPNAGLIAGLVLLVLACVGVLVGVITYLYR